jgi:hypothetical protein
MSMIASPFNGAPTGLAITTDLSVNEASDSTGFSASGCLEMLGGGDTGDEAAADAA